MKPLKHYVSFLLSIFLFRIIRKIKGVKKKQFSIFFQLKSCRNKDLFRVGSIINTDQVPKQAPKAQASIVV